jgi:hypothetical protein
MKKCKVSWVCNPNLREFLCVYILLLWRPHFLKGLIIWAFQLILFVRVNQLGCDGCVQVESVRVSLKWRNHLREIWASERMCLIKVSIEGTVAYRPVAKLWPCKQWPSLDNAHKIHACSNRTMGLCKPFVGKGSVNTFPRKRTLTQQYKNDVECGPRRGVFLKTVQLAVVIWKSACEEKTRRLVWKGRQPGTQLVVSSAWEDKKRWRYSWVDSGK